MKKKRRFAVNYSRTYTLPGLLRSLQVQDPVGNLNVFQNRYLLQLQLLVNFKFMILVVF